MTGYFILCVFTVVCAILQIIFRPGEDKFNWQNIALTLFSAIGMIFVVACTRVDFPGLWPYAVGVCIVVIIASLTNHIGKLSLYFSLFFSVFAVITPSYGLKQPDEQTYMVYGKFTHWITGKVHAVGNTSSKINVIVSRGRAYNRPVKDDVIILKDSQGSLYIPEICKFDDGYKDYEIQFYKNLSTSVNVIKLLKEDGSYVIKDFVGKDTSSSNYSTPEFDDTTSDFSI